MHRASRSSRFKCGAPSKRDRAIAQKLLKWFRANARDLPWRRTNAPYAIWVSEIMLQQTQVKTVIPYWRRWLQKFPTVRALAHARPEAVLKLWEGLGYYSRARNLHRAAKAIVHTHGGRFPDQFEDLLALPGVGRYTAGAVCSIAFNRPTPILDGNALRVFTRLEGIDGDPKVRATNLRLWQTAENLVLAAGRLQESGQRNCSHLNQALMELGATICTARTPKCLLCPVRRHCTARAENRVHQLPAVGGQRAATQRRFVALVLERRGRFLVRQRPAGVVNAHLWEFPNVEVPSSDCVTVRTLRRLFGGAIGRIAPLLRIKHSITKSRITLDAFRAESVPGAEHPWSDGRWLNRGQLSRLAFPSAHRKILDWLRRHRC